MSLCDQKYRTKLFTCICGIVCLYLTTIYFDIKMENFRSHKIFYRKIFPQVKSNNSIKYILYWTKMFSSERFYFEGNEESSECPGLSEQICLATNDRYAMNIEDFDVLLFHHADLDINDLPVKRSSKQSYIYVNMESPISYSKKESFDNYFNYTMTYRLDSDIPRPYFAIRNKITGNIIWPIHKDSLWKAPFNATGIRLFDRNRLKRNIEKKRKSVAWFVSHCNAKSARDSYVSELAKHIDVDVYGNCGTKFCPRSVDCLESIVEPDYFFHLSFENSLCQDYVTEKFFNALKYDVIPIVYSGANFSYFAPTNSYINSLDFNSPKDLAQFLKKLIKDKDEYAKYFEWKETYEVIPSEKLTFCELCNIIHNNPESKTCNPLSKWYYNNKCPLQDRLQNLPYLTKSAI